MAPIFMRTPERSGRRDINRLKTGDHTGGNTAFHKVGHSGAAAVIHHDLLADRPAHLVGDHAPQGVVAAAGRKRDDERDRPGGVYLRGGRAGSE
jgi:hypothetical protein